MQRAQKRVLRFPRKRVRPIFSPEVRALVRRINGLEPKQRDFILGHLLCFGPESQLREVSFYLRCICDDELR